MRMHAASMRVRVRIPVRARARRARTSFPAAAVAPPREGLRPRPSSGARAAADSASPSGSANQLFVGGRRRRLLSEGLLRTFLGFRGDGGGLFILGGHGFRRFLRLGSL